MPDPVADFPNVNAVPLREFSRAPVQFCRFAAGRGDVVIQRKDQTFGMHHMFPAHGFEIADGHGNGRISAQRAVDFAHHHIAGSGVAAGFSRKDFLADGLARFH